MLFLFFLAHVDEIVFEFFSFGVVFEEITYFIDCLYVILGDCVRLFDLVYVCEDGSNLRVVVF